MNKLSFADVKKMKRGVNTSEEFTFPYLEGVRIGVRVLSQEEITECGLIAKKKANDYIKQITGTEESEKYEQNVIGDYGLRELIYRFCVIPGTELEKFFDSPEDVASLTVDEQSLLMEYYEEVQEKYAPVRTLEKPEDFDSLIEDIKKKGLSGMSLSTYTLRKLLAFMVVRQEILPNDNGTTSMPSNQLEVKKKENKLTERITTELIGIEQE